MSQSSGRRIGPLHRACVIGFLVFAPAWLVMAYGDQPGVKQKPKTTFKASMAKVPAKEREKFLTSLSFKKGGISGAYVKGVKGALPPAEYKAMLANLGCSTDHEGYRCGADSQCFKSDGYICNPEVCARPAGGSVILGTILAKLNAAQKTKFLSSLDFAKGRLVGAYTTDVKARLATKDFEKLFTAMGVTASDLKAKTRAGVFKASPAK
jgi:hypothetical protein